MLMSKRVFTRKENIVYGGAASFLAIVGIIGMLALYELIENLFNLPV